MALLAFGEAAVIGGILLSYYWSIATGAMIVLVAIALYLGAVALSR